MPNQVMKMRNKNTIQTSMLFRQHGGKRQGAGRKEVHRDRMSHKPRMKFARATAVHVTLKMTATVFNLRSRRSFRVIQRALQAHCGLKVGERAVHGATQWKRQSRFGALLVEFSVLGDHIHLVMQAESSTLLSKAVQALEVRIARGLNKMMGRKGQVFRDRYHAVILTTPSQVRNARHYVRHNFRQHVEKSRPWVRMSSSFVDPYSSQSPALAAWLPTPTMWILSADAERKATKFEQRRRMSKHQARPR
jgi:REP element-mobilizing transposase RayT